MTNRQSDETPGSRYFCTRCRQPVSDGEDMGSFLAGKCACEGSPSPWVKLAHPRWCYGDTYLTPLETDVYALFQRVEQLGAHPLLTDASAALMKARDSLVGWADEGSPGGVTHD